MITAWQQLSTKACTQTKRIAVVRIHVERAIQRLKGYKILQGIFFSIPLVPVADQTSFVCATHCNLMKLLVKLCNPYKPSTALLA